MNNRPTPDNPSQPGDRVPGYRNVTTRGTYMGEEGVGYGWGDLPQYGDFSAQTGGHIQGSTAPVTIEILVPGAYFARGESGETFLFVPGDEYGMRASEAIMRGFARVREE